MTRYQVEAQAIGASTAYRLIDSGRHAEAVVYPALGQNCVEFSTTPDGQPDAPPISLFVPPDDIESLRKIPFLGGNPILFPFPNRVRDGKYTFEGTAYHMDALMARKWDKGGGQAIHGLVGDREWTVEDSGADSAGAFITASLRCDSIEEIRNQFPFPCRIEVTYRLADGLLRMIIKVHNTGTTDMPMGFGIHPWFPVRLKSGDELPQAVGEISDIERRRALVKVPAGAIWELQKLMPTGTILTPDQAGAQYDLSDFEPLQNHFFDDVFTKVQAGADGWSEGGMRDPESGREMYLRADEGFREWVLYAPLDRKVIALEPYTCATDAVNLQARGIDAGLITLAAGETWAGEIQFGLR